MATRRLTDAFLLLRNNSIQNRQLLAEQLADDRMALVSGISLDPEAAIGVTKRSPPKWVDGVDEGFTDDQLVLVEQNTLMVEEREREIRQIVQSISDLNEIFRDLGAMIVEQGTVLDRIDYNVEQSCIKTEDGLKQLHKAEQYQKKNRKMLVILILFVIIIVLIVVLVSVKSH
uniref:Syntaxin 16 n=1 Tax=Equus caballus TaxID=9796 RepID=A0A9L0S9U5_HORSE